MFSIQSLSLNKRLARGKMVGDCALITTFINQFAISEFDCYLKSATESNSEMYFHVNSSAEKIRQLMMVPNSHQKIIGKNFDVQ